MSTLLTVNDALRQILGPITVFPESVPTPDAWVACWRRTSFRATTSPISEFQHGWLRRAGRRVAGASATSRAPAGRDGHSAGRSPDRPLNVGEAARIMTGRRCQMARCRHSRRDTDDRWTPDGAALSRRRCASTAARSRAIHAGPGEDIRAGRPCCGGGRSCDAGYRRARVAGAARVPVVRQPRVAILSTGDELVDIDDELGPGQIRNSNSYMLAGLVAFYGGIAIRLGVARGHAG